MSEVNAPAAPAAETAGTEDKVLRKRVIGIVSSDKMLKTRVVSVTEMYRHAKYGKYIKRTQKFHVHDERNDAKVGDKVLITESRPLSKTKRWRLIKVLERAL